ncbi:12356_t:CDS:1, partial [Funneliformis geosporum]
DIRKSPNWDQNVNFTLKDCLLYDIDRHRNDYLDHRLSKTETTAIQLEKRAMRSENKFFLFTVSIISSIVARNYISKKESVKPIRKE